MSKIPTWREFTKNPKFNTRVGLCYNISCMPTHRIMKLFYKFLKYKQLRSGYPVGMYSYVYDYSANPYAGITSYTLHENNGTLYVGHQLELRKHLYKQFRVWAKRQL